MNTPNPVAPPNVPLPPEPASFSGWMGIARADITPEIGIYARNWGAARHDASEAIHRPLTATVSALAQAPDQPVCLVVSVDLGWWKCREDENWMRSLVSSAASVPADRVFLNLSHTHSGPSVHLGDSNQPGGDRISAYRDRIAAGLTRATQDAVSALQPVRARWIQTTDPISVLRDMPDPNTPEHRYLVGWNPDAPANLGLIAVGRFCRSDGTPVAAWVHAACHPTTLGPDNRAISPDYPGALREVIEESLGIPCQFLQGASGDRSPIEQYVADPEVADRHGRAMGHAALAAWHAMPPVGCEPRWTGCRDSGAALGIWESTPVPAATGVGCQTITVPLEVKPSVDAVPGEADTPAAAERLTRARHLRTLIGDNRPFELEIPVMRFGNLFLCGIPGEAYTEFAAAWSAMAPGALALACNCTNGWFGYLPPRRVYDLPSVYPALQSPFTPGCHEAVVDTLARAFATDGIADA
jgi:hypothetical protein